jgi:hypothetical protein
VRYLFQVADAAWVNIDAIEAVVWHSDADCPLVILKCGEGVNATKFADDDSEAGTTALVDEIQLAYRRGLEV